MRLPWMATEEIARLGPDQRRLGFATEHAMNGWPVTPHILVAFVHKGTGKVVDQGELIRTMSDWVEYYPIPTGGGTIPRQRAPQNPESIHLADVLMVAQSDLDAHHERMQNANAL